jgi:hypothetical protein
MELMFSCRRATPPLYIRLKEVRSAHLKMGETDSWERHLNLIKSLTYSLSHAPSWALSLACQDALSGLLINPFLLSDFFVSVPTVPSSHAINWEFPKQLLNNVKRIGN